MKCIELSKKDLEVQCKDWAEKIKKEYIRYN